MSCPRQTYQPFYLRFPQCSEEWSAKEIAELLVDELGTYYPQRIHVLGHSRSAYIAYVHLSRRFTYNPRLEEECRRVSPFYRRVQVFDFMLKLLERDDVNWDEWVWTPTSSQPVLSYIPPITQMCATENCICDVETPVFDGMPDSPPPLERTRGSYPSKFDFDIKKESLSSDESPKNSLDPEYFPSKRQKGFSHSVNFIGHFSATPDPCEFCGIPQFCGPCDCLSSTLPLPTAFKQ